MGAERYNHPSKWQRYRFERTAGRHARQLVDTLFDASGAQGSFEEDILPAVQGLKLSTTDMAQILGRIGSVTEQAHRRLKLKELGSGWVPSAYLTKRRAVYDFVYGGRQEFTEDQSIALRTLNDEAATLFGLGHLDQIPEQPMLGGYRFYHRLLVTADRYSDTIPFNGEEILSRGFYGIAAQSAVPAALDLAGVARRCLPAVCDVATAYGEVLITPELSAGSVDWLEGQKTTAEHNTLIHAGIGLAYLHCAEALAEIDDAAAGFAETAPGDAQNQLAYQALVERFWRG